MTRLRGFSARNEGASAVEFALTAPLFLALAFGVVNLGLALWTQFGIQNAVEAAARCQAIDTSVCPDSNSTAQYAAQNALGANVPASAFTVAAADCGDQVKAQYVFTFFTSYFGTPQVTLSAQSCYPV